LADLAVDPQHQHRIAGLWHARAPEALHCGHEGHADPGRFSQGDAGRLLDNRISFDHEVGGMGAVTADAEVAGRAEHLLADEVGRTVEHCPAKSRPGVRGKTA
jgi:hypothetical protein